MSTPEVLEETFLCKGCHGVFDVEYVNQDLCDDCAEVVAFEDVLANLRHI